MATTYFSWRWVFVGEVVLVAGILVLARRIADAPPEAHGKLDVVGSVLSAAGLGLAVFGVLRSAEWGWVLPKAGGPSWFGLSPSVWFVLGGLLLVWLFLEWENHLEGQGREPLVRPSMFGNRQMNGGLVMFFFQYLVQAGLFFTIPLFLSVALGLSALETGVRILPLSITLLAAAVGIPRLLPNASPRRVVRLGLLAMFAGIVILLAALDTDAERAIVTVPLLLAGLGHRRPGLAARRSDGVRRARRAEPRGRWTAEHRHQPGCLDRHRPGRLDPDRGAHGIVPAGRPAEPVDPRRR